MDSIYLFYNPKAAGGQILEDLEALEFVLDAACVQCNLTRPETYAQTLFQMSPEASIVLCGGDGTLNRFVNLTRALNRSNTLYYFPAGEHNDFARDYGRRYGNNPFPVDRALQRLPKLYWEGKQQYLLTGLLLRASEKTGPQLQLELDGKSTWLPHVHLAAVYWGNHVFGTHCPDETHRRGEELAVLLFSGSQLGAKRLLRRLERGRPLPKGRRVMLLRGKQLSMTFSEPMSALADGEPLQLKQFYMSSPD